MSFTFQYPLLFLRLSSSCLRLLPRLSVTSIVPSMFLSITCFGRQFLRKMWPIQLTSFFLILNFPFLLTVSNTSSFLTWPIPLIYSVFLQLHSSDILRYAWYTRNFQSVQHNNKFCTKLSTLLVSPSNLSPIVRWKDSSFCSMLHLP